MQRATAAGVVGGFNGTAPPVQGPAGGGGGNLFASETVHDVEVGAKLAGEIANRPARLNVALYNQWIDNVQGQVNVVPPGRQQAISVTVNVDQAEVSGPMDLRADLYAQTYTYFSNNNSTITPDTRLPGYGLLNMRYEWHDVLGSKLSFAAFAKNLTDRQYHTGGFALTASLGVNGVSVGEPRMFGAELSYSF
jgi:outer membrane receptor protein involved in Fe transport